MKINAGKLEQNTEIHNPNTHQSSDAIFSLAKCLPKKKSVVNIGIKLCNTVASPMRKLGEKTLQEEAQALLITTYILLRR
jgi:hypothetical protein